MYLKNTNYASYSQFSRFITRQKFYRHVMKIFILQAISFTGCLKLYFALKKFNKKSEKYPQKKWAVFSKWNPSKKPTGFQINRMSGACGACKK